MVLLACLATIEFFDDSSIPPRLVWGYEVVPTAADGRCLWTSLWLATKATKRQLYAWFHRPRNATGVTSGKDAIMEKDFVCDWALRLEYMPAETRKRVINGITAETADIDPSMNYSKPVL